MLRSFYAILLATSLALPLAAQSDRGFITGKVLDPSGAAVARAQISARNQATGVAYKSVTNELGNYVVQQVPFGRYEVAVEASGFRRYVRKDVEINIAQTLTLNVTLELGQVEQAVEVTAASGGVEASTSDIGTTVSRDRIIELPLQISGNMRSPESFIFTAPGVTGTSRDTQVNGSQSRAKEVLFDGIGSTSPESGGLLFTYPSVEAVGEFKLLTSNFSAEYGRTGGGFEIFTTKSGGNGLHGSVFEYFRNDALDARGFFPKTTPINRQNEFGFTLGGPVTIPKVYNGKNKTFFHVVYSGFRYRAGATNELFSLPASDARSGDFSRIARLIYDPASTRTVNGQITRTAFPNNVIPQNRISAVAKNMVALLPGNSSNAVLNNFLSVGAQTFTRDQVDVKIDHNFSDRSRLNGFVYIGTQNTINAERLPNPFTDALNEDYRSRWARLNHDYVFSPSLLNNFRIGFTREGQFWHKLSTAQGWPEKIGLTGVATGDQGSFPRITFTDGYTNWSDQMKSYGSQVNNAWQITDSVSYIRGNHSFRAGLEGRWLQTNGADFFLSQGGFYFNALETGLPGTAASGNGFASFLLGAVHNGAMNVLAVVPGNRYRYLAGYVQDDWKATRKLTFNLGFRYEVYFPRVEAHDNMSGFDPSLANPGAGGRFGAVAFLGSGAGRNGQSSFADTYYKNFGPRIGFAYSRNDKAVIRGGYGIYYAPGNAPSGLRSSQNFGFGFNAPLTPSTTDNGVTPAFSLDNGFPQNFARPPIIDPTVANGNDVNYIGRGDGRPPYFQNWSLDYQRLVKGGVTLDVAYVGVKGTRLGTNLISMNEVDPKYLSLGSTLSQQVGSAAATAANIVAPYAGFKGSVAQALRPYPQYLNILNRSNPNGNSTYHAMQAKVEKRFAKGLSFLANYTFSKSISDADVQAGGGQSGQTYYNRLLEKAISDNDVPHIFNLSYVYELPFGPGKRFCNQPGKIAKLAGGWSVAGIQQYQAGKPIILTANNTAGLFNGALRPNVIAGKPLTLSFSDPAKDLYINPAAFAAPAAYSIGSAARSYTDLRAHNFYNESVSLTKRTKIAERMNLLFRAEYFNLFNRTQFAAPAANVSNANFGKISAQSNMPRQGQLALRLEF